MTFDASLMLVGAIIAVLPFLGFPNSWDHALFFILGVIVIAMGIALRRRGVRRGMSADRPTVQRTQTFAEAAPQSNDFRS